MAAITSSEDISTEILLRLPAMSVLNLQTLSKLWLSIISSPRFRQTHASRHRHTDATTMGLFFVGKDTPYYGYLPIGRKNPKLSFHDIRLDSEDSGRLFTCSCNGLLLLRSLTFESHDDVKIYKYHVYNPTTKEYKTLDIPTRIRNNRLVLATLAFDPSESSHYKVVFLWRQDEEIKIEVYSSMTETCKTPKTKSFYGDLDFYRNGVFCNGSIHWLTYMTKNLISFDVHCETIKGLPGPDPWYSEFYYFGQSRGHLYFVQSEIERENSSFLNVYQLKMDYSGWAMKYRVEKYETLYRALSIFINEEEDDPTMVLLVGEEWVEYNLEKNTTKRMCKVPFRYYNSSFPHQFIPTLTCL